MNLIDEVVFGIQKADTSTGRYANGTGDFVFMMPSFSEVNNQGIATDIHDYEVVSGADCKPEPI